MSKFGKLRHKVHIIEAPENYKNNNNKIKLFFKLFFRKMSRD